jgi:hypothetical protein
VCEGVRRPLTRGPGPPTITRPPYTLLAAATIEKTLGQGERGRAKGRLYAHGVPRETVRKAPIGSEPKPLESTQRDPKALFRYSGGQ